MEDLKIAIKECGLNVSDDQIQSYLSEMGLSKSDLTSDMIKLVVEGMAEVKAVRSLAKVEPSSGKIAKKSRGKKELQVNKVAQDVAITSDNPFLSTALKVVELAEQSEERTDRFQEAVGVIFNRERTVVSRIVDQYYEAVAMVGEAELEQMKLRGRVQKEQLQITMAQAIAGVSE